MRLLLCLLAGCLAVTAFSQTQTAAKKERNHSFYFSWGYNAESYTKSSVYISQPELNRDYTLRDVVGHDHQGWNEGIFHQELTIPQYSYRIGWMFNERKGWGVEINFDHTKYIIRQGQTVRLTGNLGDGKQVDSSLLYTEGNGFFYYLNNGANFFLLNAVKRLPLWENKRRTLRVDGLGKVGVGPVVPHVENSFFGDKNDPHFQIGGWNTGIEADVKVTAFRHVYLEGGIKGDYARYSGLRIYKGTARQAFGSFIFLFSLGVQF